MSWSSFNVNLGLDEPVGPGPLDPDAGYNVLTTGGDTLEARFRACGEGRLDLGPDRFHLGVAWPPSGAGRSVTVRVYPVSPSGWSDLRRADPAAYREEKARVGATVEAILERFALPGLGPHVVVRDLASPATYARYSGSPSGAIYDMAPTVGNFGRTRVPMRTPVEGLLAPHFVHGVLGAMISGFQAADCLLDGAWMGGRALPEAGGPPPAAPTRPRSP
jgi:phytoene dehydrogenase-like protein